MHPSPWQSVIALLAQGASLVGLPGTSPPWVAPARCHPPFGAPGLLLLTLWSWSGQVTAEESPVLITPEEQQALLDLLPATWQPSPPRDSATWKVWREAHEALRRAPRTDYRQWHAYSRTLFDPWGSGPQDLTLAKDFLTPRMAALGRFLEGVELQDLKVPEPRFPSLGSVFSEHLKVMETAMVVWDPHTELTAILDLAQGWWSALDLVEQSGPSSTDQLMLTSGKLSSLRALSINVLRHTWPEPALARLAALVPPHPSLATIQRRLLLSVFRSILDELSQMDESGAWWQRRHAQNHVFREALQRYPRPLDRAQTLRLLSGLVQRDQDAWGRELLSEEVFAATLIRMLEVPASQLDIITRILSGREDDAFDPQLFEQTENPLGKALVWAMLRTMPRMYSSECRHLAQVTALRLLLALQRSHRRHGVWPHAWEDLIADGLLDQPPVDPVLGIPYVWDRAKGCIRLDVEYLGSATPPRNRLWPVIPGQATP